MIEAAVIVFLLAFIGIQEYHNRKERKRLMEAFLAKNLPELKQGELTEKLEPPEEETEPEFRPVEEASDEEFTKAIKKELGREGRLDKAKETLKKVTRR